MSCTAGAGVPSIDMEEEVNNMPRSTSPTLDNNNGGDNEESAEGRSRRRQRLVMQNELILSNIASHMAFPDLLRLRETCYSWNATFVPVIISKQAPLILAKDDTVLDDLQDSDFKHRMINMSDYTKFVVGSRNTDLKILFSNYKIPAPTSAIYKQMAEFFSICRPSIKQLSVDDDVNIWENVSNPNWMTTAAPSKLELGILRQIVFVWTPALVELEILLQAEHVTIGQDEERLPPSPTWIVKEIPNLRRLDVHLEITPTRGLAHFLVDVLVHAPQLKTLYFSGIQPDFLRLPFAIHASNPQLLSKLTCLRLPDLPQQDIRQLINLAPALRLQQLQIQIDTATFEEGDESGSLWRTLLHTQAKSLHKLELSVVGICSSRQELESRTPFSLFIPHLPAVRVFRRDRIGMAPIIVKFGEETATGAATMMNIALPGLRRLEYYHINNGAGTPFAADGNDVCTGDLGRMFHPGVTELALHAPFDATGILAFPSRLIGVTHLELLVTYKARNQLTAVWSAWPELKSLTIYYRDDRGHEPEPVPPPRKLELDELLSGIPKAKHGLLKAELGGLEVITLGRLRALHEKYKSSPALVDLCHLKKFELRAVDWPRRSGSETVIITDIGGYFGLALANPGLQFMAIGADGKDETNRGRKDIVGANGVSISDHCLQFIKSAFSSQAVFDV